MTHRTVRTGYVSQPKSRREIAARKYPFSLIGEGEFLHPPWPMEELDRVRSAVRHFNLTRKACLTISIHPNGFEDHGPCVQVGWPKGAVPVVPRKRGPKRQ